MRTVSQFAKSYHHGLNNSLISANFYSDKWFKKKNILGETFIKYDYGPQGNLEHYGQLTPPTYDLSRVTAPVYLFWGDNDLLTTPEVLHQHLFQNSFLSISNKLISKNLRMWPGWLQS